MIDRNSEQFPQYLPFMSCPHSFLKSDCKLLFESYISILRLDPLVDWSGECMRCWTAGLIMGAVFCSFRKEAEGV